MACTGRSAATGHQPRDRRHRDGQQRHREPQHGPHRVEPVGHRQERHRDTHLNPPPVGQLEHLGDGDDAITAVDGGGLLERARCQPVGHGGAVGADEHAGLGLDAHAADRLSAVEAAAHHQRLLERAARGNRREHVAGRERLHEPDVEDRLAIVGLGHLAAGLVEEEERRALLGLHRRHGRRAAVDARQVLGQDPLGVGSGVVDETLVDDPHHRHGTDRGGDREHGGDEHRQSGAHAEPPHDDAPAFVLAAFVLAVLVVAAFVVTAR